MLSDSTIALLGIIAVAIVIVILFSLVKWISDLWKFTKTVSAFAPAILESGPFYKLMDILFGRSHALERHGPITTIEQQVTRANKGITPEGLKQNPVDSSRWNSHYPLLQSVQSAKLLWKSESESKRSRYVFKFDQPIGTVVLKKTKTVAKTSVAFVVVNKRGEVVTAFPIMQTESLKSNHVFHLLQINNSKLAVNQRILGSRPRGGE